MFMMEALVEAAQMVFRPIVFYWIFIGLTVGISIGALPGLTAATGIALMLPVAFFMDTSSALGLIIGLYKGGVFGGSISAITFSTPGTPASAATTYDGYLLTQQGQGRKALDMALYSSITGDTFSDLVTIFCAPIIAMFALSFGPTERFLIILLAFILIGTLSGKHPIKGLISACLGMFLALIGTDPLSMTSRLTFGLWWLRDGIQIIPLVIGFFALGKMFEEVYTLIIEKDFQKSTTLKIKRIATGDKLTFKEYLSCWREIGIGTFIGTIVGALPGLGSTVGSFLSYSVAKQVSPNKEKIGHGALEGIAASEAGNNATVGPTLIPLLAFGIPGSVIAALIGGALSLHGATPSPRLFDMYPQIVYSLFIILLISNFFNLFVGRFATYFYSYLGLFPKSILIPFICLMAIIGTYASRNNPYDVLIMIIMGLLAYFMSMASLPSAPLIMAFILAPLMEVSLRRALLISSFNYWKLIFNSNLSIVLAIANLTLFFLIISFKYKQRRR